jgi:uncharacterized membrane protein
MKAKAAQLGRSVGVVGLVAVPAAAHLAAQTDRGTTLMVGLIAFQAALVMWIVLSFTSGARIRQAGSLAAFLVTLAVWRFAPQGALLSSAVPHALIYLALLGVFAASLAPGRSAIITVLAQKVRGELPSSVVLYTRRITMVWCGFFAAQLLGSALLFLFAPFATWSLFVNVLDLPLIGAMFTVEFFYRQWRHAHEPRDRFSDIFRMVSQVKDAANSHAK